MTNDPFPRRLGEGILRFRAPILVAIAAVTVFFAWHATSLRLETRFDELLPQSHPFLEVHRENAKTFGGANTVQILIEVTEGDVFNVDTLGRIFRMTREIDRLYGVNHYLIESIAHRTNRTLRVGTGGLMEMQPVMDRAPETAEEVDRVRRIVHNSANLYGVLVSLDDRAALIRASFIEGRLDHRKLFRELDERIIEPFEDDKHRISIAGEPRLYGWVYEHAGEVKWILAATVVVAWILLLAWFRDWRGALRPTLSGAVAAVWGLGFIATLGFSLDPLTLVIPFFVTARAISHSAQMHERYYEEIAQVEDPREASLRAFSSMFAPTLSAIATDALGILAILLVPIPLLQKLAIGASFWIGAIVVSELILNPIVYALLRAPSRRLVASRFDRAPERWARRASAFLTTPGRPRWVLGCWIVVLVASAGLWTQLVVGDPESVTPLLDRDSPYNVAHRRIQERFGGVEPLIIVVESDIPGALAAPANVKTIEKLQRHMEKDPGVGATFSFVDVITTMGMNLHEGDPQWGVIPSSPRQINMLFGAFFMGVSYEETSRFMDPKFTKTAVFAYATDHRGSTVERVVDRAEGFIADHPLEGAEFRMAGGLIGVLAAANRELLRNDVLLNVVGFSTIFLVVAIAYRSLVAGALLLSPVLAANAVANAAMGALGIGINVQTLPVITVGIGFGIDFAFYVVSRTREELGAGGDLAAAVRKALETAGKTVAFTAVTMIVGTLFWTASSIRFNAEMGLVLAIWMFVSFLASVTLLPALTLATRPRFVTRAGRG